MSSRDEPRPRRPALLQPPERADGDAPMRRPLRDCFASQPPETPQEPLEFLSRSWSISALQVAKALDARRKAVAVEQQSGNLPKDNSNDFMAPLPFKFASTMTAHLVMDRILAQQADLSPSSRKNPLSACSVNHVGSRPDSPPMQRDDLMFCRSFSAVRNPFNLRDFSMKRWLKDAKLKRKEANRAHNARIHAAVSVAGVAAAVAAVTAATASSSMDNRQSKTSMAVASAAALVAAQCVEVAETMGAAHDHISSVLSSAVHVKTPGDIMTLTAAAATALRASAALNSRVFKDSPSVAACIPHENCHETIMTSASESISEDGETDCHSPDCLSKGCEFLKRTRKGEFHWRLIFAYLNKDFQVVVKSQGKYMGGTITKIKKRFVVDVYNDIPSWPERAIPGNREKRWCFGIKTDDGVMELECKTEADYRLWTAGISRLLSVSQNQMQR